MFMMVSEPSINRSEDDEAAKLRQLTDAIRNDPASDVQFNCRNNSRSLSVWIIAVELAPETQTVGRIVSNVEEATEIINCALHVADVFLGRGG